MLLVGRPWAPFTSLDWYFGVSALLTDTVSDPVLEERTDHGRILRSSERLPTAIGGSVGAAWAMEVSTTRDLRNAIIHQLA